MKKRNATLLCALGLVITSCGTGNYYMKAEEITSKEYTLDGWSILKSGKVVGTLTSTEWEFYKNKLVREISIVTSFSSDEEMKEIGRFVHTKFPDCKIEVNEDGGNSFPTPSK